MTKLKHGDIINLENGAFVTPDNVKKIRLEIHGGIGGNNEPGEGGMISAILDFDKTEFKFNRTILVFKGERGGYGAYYSSEGGGGGGGGGSSAILIDDIRLLEAEGGDGGKGLDGGNGHQTNNGGSGGNGYINGESGKFGYYAGGAGGRGGGTNYISNALISTTPTQQYSSGLAIIEILETNPYFLLRKNNNFYSINPEFYLENETYTPTSIDVKHEENERYMENFLNKYFSKVNINNEIFRPIDKFNKFNLVIKK